MRKILLALALLAAGCGEAPAVKPPAGPSADPPVTREVAKPSVADVQESWRITRQGAEHEIEGYADEVSVLPGERFRLHVSTTAPRFSARAFRMGANPSKVWESAAVRGGGRGRRGSWTAR
ncbi:hypothetical protein ACFQ0B_64125 [Nonomuraea thailandensis]